MKKLFVLSLLIFPAVTYAQFDKGNFFVGGTLSGSVQRSNLAGSVAQYSSDLFSISPTIGFFLNKKIAIGASVAYTAVDSKAHNINNLSTSDTKSKSVSIGPYIRFYQPISSSFYFALQGAVGFTRGNTKAIIDNPPVETVGNAPTYSLTANIKPILIFFPSRQWSVEASIGALGYTYQRSLPDAGSTSTFSISAGGFTLGAAYYFMKKPKPQ